MNEETATTSGGKESSIQNLINVFISPREAFESVDRKPTWVLPFVIVLVAALAFSIVIMPMAMDQKMAEQREKLIEDRGMTPEEADEAMVMGEKIGKIVGPVVAPIGAALVLVVISAVLLFLGNIILGGDGNFKKVFSMYTWSSLIGVLGSIIKVPVMMSKDTMELQTSLAAFMSADDKGTFLYQLLAKTDIFAIWQIAIVCIGMAVIYKFTTKKAAYGVVGLYLVFAIVASLIGAALS